MLMPHQNTAQMRLFNKFDYIKSFVVWTYVGDLYLFSVHSYLKLMFAIVNVDVGNQNIF